MFHRLIAAALAVAFALACNARSRRPESPETGGTGGGGGEARGGSGVGGTGTGGGAGVSSCDGGVDACQTFHSRYSECGGDLDWTCTFDRCDLCTLHCVRILPCSSLLAHPGDQDGGVGLSACLNQCRTMHFCDDTFLEPWRVCDGIQGGSDGSDELDSECSKFSNGFRCAGRSDRIPRRDVCNGVTDCPDGDDEALCPVGPNGVDPFSAFLCFDGNRIVPKEKLCDVTPDCDDASDESSTLGCGSR